MSAQEVPSRGEFTVKLMKASEAPHLYLAKLWTF